MMGQKGTHTWDLFLDYHQCPKCGVILECRKSWEYRLGRYVKEVQCDSCGHTFSLEKDSKPTFGPLIGEPGPKEIDWE